MGWHVAPDGLRDGLARASTGPYAPPEIVITENGAAYPDTVDAGRPGARVATGWTTWHATSPRPPRRYAGVPVTGYYVWSFLDNYEWSLGYTRRFGLVHVDFDNQRRTPKDSARWYQRLIASP